MIHDNCKADLPEKISFFSFFFIAIFQDLPTLSLCFREAALLASPQSVRLVWHCFGIARECSGMLGYLGMLGYCSGIAWVLLGYCKGISWVRSGIARVSISHFSIRDYQVRGQFFVPNKTRRGTRLIFFFCTLFKMCFFAQKTL